MLKAKEIERMMSPQNRQTQTDNKATVRTSVSAATLSFSACEKLYTTLELMTSLVFQEYFQKVFLFIDPYDHEGI